MPKSEKIRPTNGPKPVELPDTFTHWAYLVSLGCSPEDAARHVREIRHADIDRSVVN